ncbi:hypothetical protein [Brevifollis gellanilyticus]|uniref:Uncharacterized protein n=1 Tax=Brevifollis gellanilyticus TaxID=748831 RepID=A0A512MCM4_9BACT|nr:hypothetical protein [Brevifollis gellanilyticus]GEP44476.1 hypothetical protein BGE01nite_37670 [Brevifollis gellanilyticus]
MKFLLLFLLCASPALARINETPAQSEARYGKPKYVSEDGNVMSFEKAGIGIMCEFHDGLCDSISFRKIETNAKGEWLPFTADETKILLESDSNGTSWDLLSENKENGSSAWRNGDVTAYVDTKGFARIWIFTREHSRRKDAESKKEEEARKKGTLKDF